jgi:ATP-binding cassette subfamily B multidrug efflux pump
MKALWHLNKYLLKYKWLLLIGAVFVVISVIFRVFPAVFIRDSFNVIEESIQRYQSTSNFDLGDLTNALIRYGIYIVAASLLQGVFMFFMRQTIIVMSRHIEYDLKNEIYRQYQKLSMAFYKRNNTGDLMNRISEDVSRVRMYVGPAIMYALNTLALILIVVSIMFTVNVQLTLLTLAPLPLLSWAIYKVSEMINSRSHAVQEQLSTISTVSQETFSGIRIIKSFIREKSVLKNFSDEADEYNRVNEKLYRVNALFMPLMVLLIGLSTILTIYVGGILYINGSVSAGNIAEFIYYVNMLTWPVASIGWVTSIVQRAAASQERINEFLQTKPEILNTSEDQPAISGRITFKDVDFIYPDSGIQALSGLQFDLKPGQSLAVIGKTGAGKSTVAALIGRLYDASKGEVLIDGQPIAQINLDALRSEIGYVPQEGFLFSDTIYNNIGFGLDECDEAAIIAAAKDAEIHANIMDFPKGYETRIGERGVTLSGGQKQRVSIARAIIKNPKILIFDDSLSAVDTETEEKILQNLKRIMAERTTIIISHRVSSVKHSDQIIVLDKGQVIETGSHEDLLKADGYYAELYRKQLEESSSAVL